MKTGKKQKLSKREELSACLDKCCNVSPICIVEENILIRCIYCSNLISYLGHDEDTLYKAMIKWNKLIRAI